MIPYFPLTSHSLHILSNLSDTPSANPVITSALQVRRQVKGGNGLPVDGTGFPKSPQASINGVVNGQ